MLCIPFLVIGFTFSRLELVSNPFYHCFGRLMWLCRGGVLPRYVIVNIHIGDRGESMIWYWGFLISTICLMFLILVNAFREGQWPKGALLLLWLTIVFFVLVSCLSVLFAVKS